MESGIQVMSPVTPNPQTHFLPLLRGDGHRTLGCPPELDLALEPKGLEQREADVPAEPSPQDLFG